MTIYRNFSYLDKFRFGERFDLPGPHQSLAYSMVMVYEAEADLWASLQALVQSSPPGNESELLLVSWAAEGDSSQQQQKWQNELETFVREHQPSFPIHLLINHELPPKKAGKGLARKMGMDEALSRFLDLEKEDGIILCLDAGLGLPHNFWQQLQLAFQKDSAIEAVGFDFALPEKRIREELAQRYTIEALTYAQHPHAFYTLGNNFACKSKAYEKFGGISRQNRGATFQFLHKFIGEGSFQTQFGATIDLPDQVHLPHMFDRDRLDSLELYAQLRQWLQSLPDIHEGKEPGFPDCLSAFLKEEQWAEKLKELHKHSSSYEGFQKRFFAWMGIPMVAKFLRFGKSYHPPLDFQEALERLFEALEQKKPAPFTDEKRWLEWLRSLNNPR